MNEPTLDVSISSWHIEDLVSTAMGVLGRISLMFRLAIRARRAKRNPGANGIVGLTGIAQTTIAPNGTVFVRGELWPAHSTAFIAAGQSVRVAGINGISLDVDSH